MNSIEKQGMSFEQALGFLAQAQSEYNRLGKIVSTKDPESLRYACDEEMRFRYEEYGVKSVDVKIGDSTVGTYSVSKTKEKPEKVIEKLSIEPMDALRWCTEEAPEEYFAMLCEEAARIAEDYMLLTGEVLPSAKVVEETVPAEPSKFKNTILKVDAAKVGKALGTDGFRGYIE